MSITLSVIAAALVGLGLSQLGWPWWHWVPPYALYALSICHHLLGDRAFRLSLEIRQEADAIDERTTRRINHLREANALLRYGAREEAEESLTRATSENP